MANEESLARRSANQRRIGLEIVDAADTLLAQGVDFAKELNRLFRKRRQFGSRDRRLYRELVYTYARFKPWLDPLKDDDESFFRTLATLANPTPDVSALLATKTIDGPGSAHVARRAKAIGKSASEFRELVPPWFLTRFSRPLESIDWPSFFSRPPLWLRAQNRSSDDAAARLKAEFHSDCDNIVPSSTVPGAIRCPPDLPVKQSTSMREGAIEIQDVSSQILLQLIDASPGGVWLDACAGAGGKSLQLSQWLGGKGSIVAYDPRDQALDELAQRALRAGASNIEIHRDPPLSRHFAGVLIDAPCSGSGTWRRHPYLMRQRGETEEHAYASKQRALLKRYSRLVAPGGLLVYCTCSLSASENEEVSSWFLNNVAGFQLRRLRNRFGVVQGELGATIYPGDFDGDGLYIASFRRD